MKLKTKHLFQLIIPMLTFYWAISVAFDANAVWKKILFFSISLFAWVIYMAIFIDIYIQEKENADEA